MLNECMRYAALARDLPSRTPVERAAGNELANLSQSRAIECGTTATILHIRGEMAFGFPVGDLIRSIGQGEQASVFIDSRGGDVTAALRLYNAMAGKRISATVMGNCFSAAVIILCAAQERRIVDTGMIMIHEPISFHGGTVSELREAADRLHDTRQIMSAILSEHCALGDVGKWMAGGDHYMTPREALAAGLVTEIISAPK